MKSALSIRWLRGVLSLAPMLGLLAVLMVPAPDATAQAPAQELDTPATDAPAPDPAAPNQPAHDATGTPNPTPTPVPPPTVVPAPNPNVRPIPSRLRPGTTGVPLRPAATPPGRPGMLPPVAGTPGAVPGGAPAGAAGAAARPVDPDEIGLTPEEASKIEEGDLVTLNLPNAPLETALDLYAGLIRRVLLRPPQLAGGPINLKFEDLTREESIEAMNAVFALSGIAVLPVGEKFVKVVPSQEAILQGAKATDQAADEFSELGQYVTKLVKVTKIKPGDIAQAVQQFASSKVQNPVLVFDDQNFFILRDMAANVKRMVELIKELDVTPELDYKLEVIPIRYGKVEEIYDTLNSVVTGQSSGTGSRSGSTRASGFRSGTGTGTGTGPGGLGMQGNQFNPQQTGAATGARTGTGMTSPGASRTSFADRLRNVSSAASGGGGAQYNLLEDARIIPDMRSNSLLVYASREQFKMLTNIVAKIDTLLAQVLIESIILEISLGDGQTFGVSMVQRPQQFGDWNMSSGSINNADIATNIAGLLFPSGFSFFGQLNDDFAVAVRAIADDSHAKILARPRIQTTHAQPAQFEIGRIVPYPQTTSPYYGGGVGGGYTPYTTYTEKRATTRLEVTPFITPDGLVTLEVMQAIDQLGQDRQIGNDLVPEILTRSASAVLSVRDGEAVILGGFINDEKRDSKSGVPWLKDLPLLGWAFRSNTKSSSRSELIVLIRPTILDTPQEAARVAELERRNLPNAAAAAREFQAHEAEMAERLGVMPGSTNTIPVEDGKKSKSSRRKKNP